MKYIVTAGRAYADIDVLACISGYVQLLRLQGKSCEGIITGPWNQTIPSSVKQWPFDIKNTFQKDSSSNRFILVDISNPEYRESFVSIDQVVEVYDHHYGHETFWKERLGINARIEHVGACATLIWERFKESGFQNDISELNASVLYTAIFANTLNFRSPVTTKRDKLAFEELKKHIQLPHNWIDIYYNEVAEEFNKDLTQQIKKDTKTIDFEGLPFLFGQVEMWNARPILNNFDHKFNPNTNEEWLVNIASIEEDRSYFYTNSSRIREKIVGITSARELSSSLYVAKRLWLRKEILRDLYRMYSKS